MADRNGIDYSTDPRFIPPTSGINYATDPRFTVPKSGIDYTTDPRFKSNGITDSINTRNSDKIIKPTDHFSKIKSSEVDETGNTKQSSDDVPAVKLDPYGDNDSMYDSEAHTIYDINAHAFGVKDIKLKAPGYTQIGNKFYKTFSGSSTLINPTLDENSPVYLIKERILKGGLSSVEDEIASEIGSNRYSSMPTSPLHPFMRMDPLTARQTNLSSYNRSHTPIADLEFRKCFRHIFISRPECYITCLEGGLSEQAYYDEDFASLYSRMPYILELLSPRYLPSNSKLSADELNSNWNFLLSNRVMGLSFESIDIANTEGITKTPRGYSIAVGNGQTSGLEGTLNLQFRDTKYFEVYELFRMWLLYIHKRHIGIFAPPFNGYRRHNDFDIGSRVNGRINLHPYDRALEYPCTIFDIVTDESDTQILHYCEYIGAYPFTVSLPLNNTMANAITNEMTVSVGFKYSAKLINNNASLVHFNYNSGIVDDTGRPSDYTREVLPFLIQDKYENQLVVDYIGQASLFTGSPYIVMGQSHMNPVNRGGDMLYSPFLKFAPVSSAEINKIANMGITHVNINQTTGDTIGIETDTNVYSDISIDPNSIINDSTVPNVNVTEEGIFDEYIRDQEKKGERLFDTVVEIGNTFKKDLDALF